MQDSEKVHNYDEIVDAEDLSDTHKKKKTVKENKDTSELKKKLADVDRQIAEMEAKMATKEQQENNNDKVYNL